MLHVILYTTPLQMGRTRFHSVLSLPQSLTPFYALS